MKRRRHFQITTAQGHKAIINGDANMSPATRRALSELIDAAVRVTTIDRSKSRDKRVPSKPKSQTRTDIRKSRA